MSDAVTNWFELRGVRDMALLVHYFHSKCMSQFVCFAKLRPVNSSNHLSSVVINIELTNHTFTATQCKHN